MSGIPKAAYQTPAELEARIRERLDEARLIPRDTDAHRAIMQQIARLRIHADAKRWIRSSAGKRK